MQDKSPIKEPSLRTIPSKTSTMGNNTVSPPFAPLLRTVCAVIMPTAECKNAWPLIDQHEDGFDATDADAGADAEVEAATTGAIDSGSGGNGAECGAAADGKGAGVASTVTTAGTAAADDASSALTGDDVACLSCPALYEASFDVPQPQAPHEMGALLCKWARGDPAMAREMSHAMCKGAPPPLPAPRAAPPPQTPSRLLPPPRITTTTAP